MDLQGKQDDIKMCASVLKIYLGGSVTITNAFCLGQKSPKLHATA